MTCKCHSILNIVLPLLGIMIKHQYCMLNEVSLAPSFHITDKKVHVSPQCQDI